ncbi:Uncharacterized protein Fot_01452 [Forsythia ovata]|uniref:Uncharacterized protein n=1 Tax=Forsythia ovata TaxID=205694 RepID=A0ABD1X744_9LAMI
MQCSSHNVVIVYLMLGPVSTAISPGSQPSIGAASVNGTSQQVSSIPTFAGAYVQLPSSAGLSSSVVRSLTCSAAVDALPTPGHSKSFPRRLVSESVNFLQSTSEEQQFPK